MPNHHMADEKPEAVPFGYEESNLGFEEPFVHGASTVGGETGRGGDTHRGLKSRHIQFLALGGAIGTGLFIGSGSILALVGPAPLFMAYLSMMLVVYNVMNNLAEIVTYLPMRGITIPYFVKRFVDPSLAFATGWNYWYAYAILVAAEATAGSILLDYWNTGVHSAVWITIFLVVVLFLNIVAVEVFGEAEFWFASIKFLTIMGLIILGFVIMLGGSPNDQGRLGFRYWNNPGAFKPYIVDGDAGKFLAYWTAFVRAGFAFITSPELIALAAGETIAPRRNIPKAAGRFVYRLAIFYGLGSFIIGVVVPSDDDRLLSGSSNASASPFVIGIQRAGIEGLNHVVNAAVLTSAWSAGNAFLFSGSRVLYGMALNGEAPKFFGKTSKKGVPYMAVITTWAIGLLAYLNVSNTGAQVFLWFSNISTISGFIAWIVVMITYIRFRKAMAFNNLLETLPYCTPLQPYLTYFILVVVSLLTITNGFQVFVPANWSVSDFLAAYITIPIFLVLYAGHKIYTRTSFAIPVESIDVTTGVREMNELCKDDISGAPVPKNVWQKIWFWIA
ncbi:amino-acid permease inda1 [Stemphylium lycopersici]|nr:proline-specific permease [Stemphylium lycopersici]RAR10038.1 amino-acid permease inda1 [Stemphylium lycopersici]